MTAPQRTAPPARLRSRAVCHGPPGLARSAATRLALSAYEEVAGVREVVVTGGGTGIGKAVAAAFARDGNGVVVTGRRPEPLAAAVAFAANSG